MGIKYSNAFSANVILKGIESYVFVLKGRTLEQIRLCTKFAAEQMPERYF